MRGTPVKVYLGLGSNLGNRERNLTRAIELMGERCQAAGQSPIYETAPVGFEAQPKFLNMTCEVETRMEPLELLDFVQGIERSMGRVPSFRNAPRPLDIDVLLYGRERIDMPRLTVPHPRMLERAFVLVPLAEIAPDVIHPVSGRRIAELAREAPGKEGLTRWDRDAAMRAGTARGRGQVK